MSNEMVSEEDKKEILKYCFNVLKNHFEKDFKIPNPKFLNSSYPLFVTLRIKKTEEKEDVHYRLRGCVGTFETIDLVDGLKKYTKYSAFNDSRFSPLRSSEFPRISLEISLLYNFSDVGDRWSEFVIGVDGLSIDFEHQGKKYHSTYLPEVALEQGWSERETIVNLIRKSGYRSVVDDRLLKSLHIKTYKTLKFGMKHDEYIKLSD